LGSNRYKLDNSPFYAYGVSWEDVIEAVPAEDGFLEFTCRILKSGNRTLRVIFDSPTVHPESEAVLKQLVHLGCSYEGMQSRLISINVPPDADFEAVTKYLTGQANVRWEYADPTYAESIGDEANPV
jgi:hypothetical protein